MEITNLNGTPINLLELNKENADKPFPGIGPDGGNVIDVLINGEKHAIKIHWSWGKMMLLLKDGKEVGVFNTQHHFEKHPQHGMIRSIHYCLIR